MGPDWLPVPAWALAYVAVNLAVVGLLVFVRPPRINHDWILWESIQGALTSGQLYQTSTELWYVWSPVLAPVMAGVGSIGVAPWGLVHLAALGMLRDRHLIVLSAASVAFWIDIATGNTFTFVFVAAVLAVRGSARWAVVYLLLTMLMPRPVQFPLAAWLLWRIPQIRLAAIVLFLAHLGLVYLSGYLVDWVQAMARTVHPSWSIHPFRTLGGWWLLVGIPIGVALFRRRPAWAGLAVAPYWVPTYLLFALAHLPPRSLEKPPRQG